MKKSTIAVGVLAEITCTAVLSVVLLAVWLVGTAMKPPALGGAALFGSTAELDDVLAAAEVLAGLPYVDPKRLFVAGHSAGGSLTLLAAMASNRFRAAASFSGACNQLGMNSIWIPFDTSNMREFEMRSPVAYATSFKCLVRFYHGDQEAGIVAQTQTTADRAKQAGIDIGVEVVAGDHMSSVPESTRRSVKFFNRFGPDTGIDGQ